jgi:glycogen synthase
MPVSSREKPSEGDRTIVFATFETEFAPSGGLGAVMKVLPRKMAQYERCVVLAPYFKNITNLSALKKSRRIKHYKKVLTFSMQIGELEYSVDVTEVASHHDCLTYLLSSEGFFTAPLDPYINPRDPSLMMDSYTNPNILYKLTEDALFFCATMPRALAELARKNFVPTQDFILHLQDWETACVAQAVLREPGIRSVACVLTIHNPYDRHLDYPAPSQHIENTMRYLDLHYGNILSQMIPLVGSPISTVSQNFADELISDPLHTEFFARHLRDLLIGKGLVGIDNGIFGELRFPFSEEARQATERGNFEIMRQEKRKLRIDLANVLEDYERKLDADPRINQVAWGANLELSNPDLPVFFIMGRDDPVQKGFDVIAQAIRLIPDGRARYIFTPMPGDEGLTGLQFLKDLAAERPGEVKVFPFRMDQEAYQALQKGSSYLVMGSLYEPFGAANSAYLEGMPVVARATGGLVQQVVPFPSAALSRYGRQLISLFHSLNSPPTGFLFREPSVLSESEVQGWRKIITCEYWSHTPKSSRVKDRSGTPLFDAMVQSAAWALQDAIDIYQYNQPEYVKMIYNGYQLLTRFSWIRAIREYRHIYDFNSTVIRNGASHPLKTKAGQSKNHRQIPAE